MIYWLCDSVVEVEEDLGRSVPFVPGESGSNASHGIYGLLAAFCNILGSLKEPSTFIET